MLFCLAFKRNRFFIFSKREPNEGGGAGGEGGEDAGGVGAGRDVFNEKPSADEMAKVAQESVTHALGRQATIHTTAGDVTIKLFPDECPRTVENFCTHARNGYYDNVLFHRVIKGFMLQTGDPDGDGTGGTSIWGGEFEDEFHRNLRHDRPFTVSMANAGPGTNGSQFFVTTVPTPWLDNKHSVFGRVIRGMDVCHEIENVKCDKTDKPFEDIKIMNIIVA